MKTEDSTKPRFVTVPFPKTSKELADKRVVKMLPKSLNDTVDEIIHILLDMGEESEYQRFVSAAVDAEAVEGSTWCDDVMAAGLIRDYATGKHIKLVADANLAAIIMSHRVVLRRYHMDRKSRRQTVGDVVVPDEDTNGEG